MRELLPYMAGAASAFIVQFLMQVYVAPLVETRKRRLERWEKDVLDLGDLLSGRVRDAAREAMSEQYASRSVAQMADSPDYGPTTLADYQGKKLVEAREATRNFKDLVNLRAEWLMDRITFYRPSDRVGEFTQVHLRYRIHLLKLSYDEWRELPDDGWDAWWTQQNRLLAELILDLRELALDPHSLRISWRARLKHGSYRIKRRLTKITRKPLDSKPTVPPQQVESPAS